MTRLTATTVIVLTTTIMGGACRQASREAMAASGYVEATDVRIASKVAGRAATVLVTEGQRVVAGQSVVTLDTTETDLALRRAQADRDQMGAQLQLLLAGSRPDDIRTAGAQVAAADADRQVSQADLDAARVDEARFHQLIDAKAGAQKQLDDATARRVLAEAHLHASEERARVATEQLARVKGGPRSEDVEAARARVAAADAQIATLNKDRGDALIVAPSAGIVTSRLIEPGELAAPGVPLIVLVDLDHAWANVYVEEPLVPGLKVDQAATVVTDAGNRIAGHVTFISPQAEFTPKNVQTADERAKLVYRIKVSVDNANGVLKPGMPITAEFGSGS